MSDDMHQFNLVDDRWIVVKTSEGEIEQANLIEVFERAEHLEALANEIPTQDFAILRVLLAILQRSISADVDDGDNPAEVWGRLWRNETLPLDAIRSYLDQWRERFNLFDEELPFMQCASLELKKLGDPRKLMCVSENKAPLNPMRTGPKERSLTFPESARWLITAQAYDTSGIKSGAVGDPSVKNGKGMPGGTGWAGRLGGLYAEGSCLRETLLLNLILCTDDINEMFPDDDIPVWEQDAQPPFIREREPTGRADLYTWQSRRIRLTTKGSRVVSVALAVGDKIDRANRQDIEPMSLWSRSKPEEKRLGISPVYIPRRHRTDRALWRGLDAVLPSVATGENGDWNLIPGIVKWINYLTSVNGGRELSDAYMVRLRAVGFQYGTQDSLITEAINDSIDIHSFLLSPDGLQAGNAVCDCIAATDRAVVCLGQFAANLIRAEGFRDAAGAGLRNNAASRARESAKRDAYFELDRAFRQWLLRLNHESNLSRAQGEWAQIAKHIIRQIAADLIKQVAPSAIVGHPQQVGNKVIWISIPGAERRFNVKLKESFEPLAVSTDGEREVMAQ